MQILALCGSLRPASANAAVLRAAVVLAPTTDAVTLHPRLRDIPPFDPDERGGPRAVAALREAVASADALLIASPEYAHGVSGTMKNALDWLVGSGELTDLPTGLVTATSTAGGGRQAHAALLATLGAMGARVVPAALIVIDGGRPRLDADGELAEREARAAVAAAVAALASAPPRSAGV